MAKETDELLMKISLDVEELKKGITDVEKNTGRLQGIGNSIKGLGGQIKQAFSFLGIGLAMKSIIRESEDLQRAMLPIKKLMSEFGDELVPGFRILGNTIQDVTKWVSGMAQGMGEASIIARGFAVAMELLRVLVMGLVNGFVFLYNVLKLSFEAVATAIAFIATGVLNFFATVLSGWEKIIRLMVAAGRWLWQQIDTYVITPIAQGFVKMAKLAVAALEILPEKLQRSVFGKTVTEMVGELDTLDAAIAKSSANQKTFAELFNETAGQMGVLSDAVKFFQENSALAAEVTKIKWDDTKQAFLDLGANMKEINLEDVMRRLTNAAMGWGANFGIASKHVGAAVRDVANSFKITEGIVKGALQAMAAGFEVFGATGKLTAKSFVGVFIGALGDLAIALGTTIILASQAIIALKASVFGTGAAAIVLGAALIALGGILRGPGPAWPVKAGPGPPFLQGVAPARSRTPRTPYPRRRSGRRQSPRPTSP